MRLGVAAQRDDWNADALENREQGVEFHRVAALRDADDDVLLADHAEVSVHGIGRMEEKRRRAGRIKGCDDLPGDDPRFPHPRDGHPSLALVDHLDRLCKLAVDPAFERSNRLRLDADDVLSSPDDFFVIAHRDAPWSNFFNFVTKPGFSSDPA